MQPVQEGHDGFVDVFIALVLGRPLPKARQVGCLDEAVHLRRTAPHSARRGVSTTGSTTRKMSSRLV